MIGTTVSHYKIVEKLGEGGMGVVYKAQDTKLDRFVALKFLPERVAGSEQDRARFMHEAKAASALSHANVCTIYGIEEHEGQMFLVMEFVDGQTLTEKKHHLSFKQSIEIGIQLAEGLAAAHEKGIVHRDIKPDNIMIRKDGIAQIMDFGLAKLRGVSRLTKEGSTVGTAGYMSPEQVTGEDVDHRSDIFSLGVVLYELFSGQLPFKGIHETALLYEIVNVDPPPMAAVKPEIDPNLDVAVMECLEKDPNERMQSAKQLANDLRKCKRSSTRARASMVRPAMQSSTIHPSAPETVLGTARSVSKREIMAWVIAAVGVTALLWVLLVHRSGMTDGGRVIRSSIAVPDSMYVHSYGAGSGKPVLSKDGKYMAFAGIMPRSGLGIFVRSLDEKEARLIPGTEGGTNPFWSADGKMLAFFQDGKLKKVDLLGGSPTTITAVPNQRGGSWNQNDIIIYCPDYQGGLFQVAANGKTPPEPLTILDSTRHEGSHRWPYFLPDGKHFLYLARTAVESGEAEGDAIYVASLDGKVKKLLVQSSFNAAYANGYLLFARNQALMAQQFDPDKAALSGDPVQVLDDLLNDPSYNIATFSVSNNGLLVYQPGTTMAAGARPVLVDRTGNVIQTIGDNIIEQDQPRFSPDGKQIAMYMYDLRTRLSNVWIHDLLTNGRRRITTGTMGDFYPVWSPDGQTVYFTTGGVSLNQDVYRQGVTSTGREELVFSSAKNDAPDAISPDGSTLLVSVYDVKENQGDLFLLSLISEKESKLLPFQATKFDELTGRYSRDGKWIAFSSNESGEYEVYIKQSARPQSDPIKVSTGGGGDPRWGTGTNELIFLNNRAVYSATLRFTDDSGAVEKITKLFQTPLSSYNYDVSPDGRTFIFSRVLEIQKLAPLSLVINWNRILETK